MGKEPLSAWSQAPTINVAQANVMVFRVTGWDVALMMAAAAAWGVFQLFLLSSPTRSVRLTTVLAGFAVGMYGCGVAAALLELAYTRTIADEGGRALADVVRSTSYTVAPWVEELIKATPLLLVGLHVKVRRQWGVTDFVILGAGLGAGFGLLESLLRFSLDARRSIPRDGGWVIPDSLSPPFVPGPAKVFTAWLPAPSGSLDLGQAGAAMTFTHLVWTAMAGLGAGLLWRTRGWRRLLSLLPVAVAITHHTLNNYTASKPGGSTERWLENLDGKAWVMPLVCLALAMVVDLRHLHRAKCTVPGILLATERAEGDSAAALFRYACWRPPFSTLVALRFVRLRRSLMYVAALTPAEDTEPLRRVVATVAARIDASDHEDAWRTVDIRAHLKAARTTTRRRWLLLIPCLLALPSLLFLGVGSFKSTSHLQEFFTSDPGPRVLLWCGVGALAWITWQLLMLLHTLRAVSAQLVGEVLAVHRFRMATAVGSATAGGFLLYRSLGDAGPSGHGIQTFHLLEALDTFLVYLGFALLLLSLLSLLTLFPPGAGLALAGGSMLAEGATALAAGNLGVAGIVLMAVGAEGVDAGGGGIHRMPVVPILPLRNPLTGSRIVCVRQRKGTPTT
ncbi:PrsW family glutamic-type intramembrane protease [Streptomyces sp. RKAG290]|uniref:PrsW family glutamic-type intramembrane protease n=1 Tax=Streptomyces sp. RKAG290 TaxID=2888348 RepID=UPI0020340DDE|nr:PrsW family glutamic-type intramembrane protease [Streptomyces sp. RKAG290]MCM2412807.1 PrsW family glutamic-type intramembrane protease [Streptomyces sp. RKAG290]